MPHASRLRPLAYAGTLLLTLLLTPGASAELQTITETFEDDTTFQPPNGDSTGATDWYNSVTSGAQIFSIRSDSPATAHSGTKSLRVTQQTGSVYSGIQFDDLCTPSGLSPAFITWWVYFGGFPGSGSSMALGLVNAPDATGAVVADGPYITVSVTGVLSGPATPPTLTANTWYDFTIDFIDCQLAKAHFSSTTLGQDWLIDTAGSWTDLDHFIAEDSSSITTWGSTMYFDDLAITRSVSPAGFVFCAVANLEAGEDDSTDDFGYEYVEDWDFDSSLPVTLDLDDGYYASEVDGGSAYLAKGFTVGSQAFSVIFTVEAGTDTTDSVFRVAFTTGGGGTPNSVVAGASNGGTDGSSFDNHVGLRFEEEGSDWRITFRQNVAGAGYDVIGSSFTNGNPGTPTTYNFTVDSRDLTATLRRGDGTSIQSRTIDSSFLDDLWEDQWFIATGTSAIQPADTALDNNDASDSVGSTCIYDLTGEAIVTGSEGGTPSTELPEEEDPVDPDECSGPVCVTASTVPDGFTVATFNLFLGLIFTTVIAVGGTTALYADRPAAKMSGGVIGAFVAIGYLTAQSFGLVPLWPIVAAVIIMAGLLILKLKSGGD